MQYVMATIGIVIGALETMGGLQEAVVQGIFGNRSYPLIGGTLGAVAGAFVLATAIALFRGSTHATMLSRAAAGVAIPVFLLIGVLLPLTSVPAAMLGFAAPMAIVAYTHRQAAAANIA